jgi:hypothetical protein
VLDVFQCAVQVVVVHDDERFKDRLVQLFDGFELEWDETVALFLDDRKESWIFVLNRNYHA